jgi:GTP-binding protein
MMAVVCKGDGSRESFKVTKLMRFEGLERIETEEVGLGDILALAGAGSATVGDTICVADHPDPLPAISIDPPTLRMHFMPNNSPFAGLEGTFVTSRQIRERLEREAIANVGMTFEPFGADAFTVSGRGTLHLGVLIESMRREGFELSVSRPQVILREIDGVTCEPLETVIVDCDDAYSGTVVDNLNRRNGELRDLYVDEEGRARMEWIVPSRGLIGYGSEFLTQTRGTGTLVHRFSHYGPCKTHKRLRQNGVLIVQGPCETVAYALNNLQERGKLYVGPVVSVYGGQIIGLHSRENDLIVNPAKGKKLTNMRASGTDDAIQLTPPRVFALEEALEFIGEDELVEVTPASIRLRKRVLDHTERKRVEKKAKWA